jgi:hypothetical protein
LPQTDQEASMAVARVVTFEGVDPERVEALRARIEEEGRPEGIPASEILVLHDPEGRRSISILFFQNDADYAVGDETLNAVPADTTPGTRSSVGKYHVTMRMTA